MSNGKFTRAIRAYMAEHGVTYTTAKRALENGQAAAPSTAEAADSRGPAPFPSGTITVACGPDRDAVFEAATGHFTDWTRPDGGKSSGVMLGTAWQHRVEVIGRPHEDWAVRVTGLLRMDLLDEIAVPRIEEAADPEAVADMLVSLAETGSAVVVSLDVADLAAARAYFTGAVARQRGAGWASALLQAEGLTVVLLDDALLAQNEDRERDRARQAVVTERVSRRALLNAKEDVAGARRYVGAHETGYAEALDRLVLPFARMLPAKGTPAVTGSFVGGYPYVPAGVPADQVWPHDAAGQPMVFLCQVNFAEVTAALGGPLAGYPRDGLLQWFVGTADTSYGHTFGKPTSGLDGLHVRWYAADTLGAPALHSPDAEPPVDGHEDGPLNERRAIRVVFRPARGLPCVNEVGDRHTTAGQQIGAMLDAIEDARTVDDEDVPVDDDFAYDGSDLGDPNGFGAGDRIGGYPFLVQGDPRGRHPQRPGTLLIQLDSDGGFFTTWGDDGSGQLFGDPAALATGDTSSLWWDWACH